MAKAAVKTITKREVQVLKGIQLSGERINDLQRSLIETSMQILQMKWTNDGDYDACFDLIANQTDIAAMLKRHKIKVTK